MRFPALQARTNLACVKPTLQKNQKSQERKMSKFWLFIANSIGILILVFLLIWMAGLI